MSDTSPQTCPQCGAHLKTDAPAGLCPNCLMALNLSTGTVFTDPGTSEAPPLPPEEFEAHFPQLEILECLGRGGMGVVYKARQRTLNRFVALKLLAPERVNDAKFAERFAREARALAALNHPNIVTIHDFGRAGGFYFLLMEFVDGLNLRQLFRTRKLLPEEALAIVPPLCDALQFAHDRGVVHRDIKPENLLLDKDGRVKVADFGIAKMMDVVDGEETTRESNPSEDATRSTVGTPGYSAPEQKTDPENVDSRADVYSLGVVFYEMLTGELPGEHMAPPSRKVRIDVRLDEVVLRALETKPELRYQHVSEVKTHVATIVTTDRVEHQSRDTESAGNPVAPVEPASEGRRFSRAAIVGAIWAGFFALYAAKWFMTMTLPPSELPGSSLWRLVSLLGHNLAGFTAPLGTTILGWLAVMDIRRSQGVLRGMKLAVFDLLLFPLLLLNAAIAALLLSDSLLWTRNDVPLNSLFIALTCILLAVSDYLIIRLLWPVLSKPTTLSPQSGQTPARFRALVVVLVVVLPATAMLGSFAVRKIHNDLRQSPARTIALAPPETSFSAFQLRLVADETEADERTETMSYMNGGREAETLRLVPSALLDGRIVERAGWRPEAGRTNLVVALNEEGSRAFESLTSTNIGRQLAIVFQNKVLSAPVIQNRISTRQLEFTHNGSRPDLEYSITILNRLNNPPSTLQFGPLQDTVVPQFVGAQWTTFLNLGANRLKTSPHPPGESRDFHDWLNKSGADLRAVAEPRAPGLVAYGMTLVPAPDTDFNQVSAADIRYSWNLMMDQPNHLLILGKGYGTDHDTYLFRTRDDNWGVLQIIGNSDSPPGVKIRYKLVDETPAESRTRIESGEPTRHVGSNSNIDRFNPTPPPTKTIVLARATNNLVGDSTDTWSVIVFSDTKLQPNEDLRALVVTQAGEVLATRSARHTNWRETGAGISTSMSWIFKEGFGEIEADAAVKQMREELEDRPIDLTADKPFELFSVTNRNGGVMVGFAEFVQTDPQVNSANTESPTKPKAEVRITRFNGVVVPSVTYRADVPPGYALRGTASEGQVSTIVSFGEREYHSAWFSPPRGRRSAVQFGEAGSQQAVLEEQLSELRRGGFLEVALDEPLRLFSITNGPGEVLHGFLELVGPGDETNHVARD